MKSFRSIQPAITVILALILLWALCAAIVADPIRLPGPINVWQTFLEINHWDQLWSNLFVTLGRVAVSVAVAMIFGTIIGVLMGYYRTFDLYMDPLIAILLNMPALILAILAYLFIGFNEFALVFAVSLNKIPMVAITIREGVRGLNPDINAVAHLYHMPRGIYLRHVMWPQILPFVSTALRNGLALVWKIILVFEFLGRGSGIGFEIQKYFQLFRVNYILAYALAFIILMMLIEWLLVAPWDRKMQKWRKTYAYSY